MYIILIRDVKFQSDFAQNWQSEQYLSARVMMNGVPDGVNFLIFCLKGFEWPQEATSLPPAQYDRMEF